MDGEPTVVVVEGEGQEDGGAFAAGVAAATSAQAAEEAEEAVQVAEQAQETAQVAAGAAVEAESVAYDAKADVEALRGEVAAGLAELRDLFAAAAPPEPVVEEPAVPAPEPKVEKSEPTSQDTSSKSHGDEKPKSYGSARWFGGRS